MTTVPDRPKSDTTDEPEIEPKLDEKKAPGSSQPPINPAGSQRQDNETDANRSVDGTRKRAEEGL